MIAIDFLVLVGFIALMIHWFYPRFRFVSATETNGIKQVTLERYRNFPFTKGTKFVVWGAGTSWYYPDGSAADTVMRNRISNFLKFAEVAEKVLATPEKQS